MDEDRQNEFKAGPYSKLPFGVGELVRTADKIIKVSKCPSSIRTHLNPTMCSTDSTTVLPFRSGTRSGFA